MLENTSNAIEGMTYWWPERVPLDLLRFPGRSSTIIFKKDAEMLANLGVNLKSALTKNEKIELMSIKGDNSVTTDKLMRQRSNINTLSQAIRQALERYNSNEPDPFAKQIAQLKEGKMENAQQKYGVAQAKLEEALKAIRTDTHWWSKDILSSIPRPAISSSTITLSDQRVLLKLHVQLVFARAVNVDAAQRVAEQGDKSIAIGTLMDQRSKLDSLSKSIESAIASSTQV